ncbi:AMP-binding protein, partial [Flavobacteriaceae bacterium]|nr:AMP-binding protein [Flavobacteriaceae bacterium]
MKNYFYYNVKNNEILAYEDVIEYIQKPTVIYVNYHFASVKLFFLNLFKALYFEYDIVINDISVLNKGVSSKNTESDQTSIELTDIINRISKTKSKLTLFTSGTTGQPKAVIHSLNNLIRGVKISEKNSQNNWGLAYNPTHIGGLQVIFQAFFNSNPLYDIFKYSKEEIIEILNEKKITNISATPTFYRFLVPLKEPNLTIKRISIGGERADEKLCQLIYKSFPNGKLRNIYASTEAGTLLTSTNEVFKIPKDKRNLIKIVDNEIVVQKEYLGSNVGKKNWYKTGDIVKIVNARTQEFIFISRSNEMINVGGNNVNPFVVESVIDKIEGVEKSIVYGVKNKLIGNILFCDIKIN